MKAQYRVPRGLRDILPDEVERWRFVERTCREVFERYGFRELRTPLLESTELFARSVGASSDIVRKEMYTFARGEESFSLRPENTAPVVRAFIEHALYRQISAGYPERYYYLGPMFRYERPQKGRQRQFHQIGVEVLGTPEPLADAETLEMLWSFLDALGVADRELVIGSVGDSECRPRFRETLLAWLEPRRERLCADCRRRLNENPLRVLDCKVDADRRILSEAPTVLESLCAGCAGHFQAVRALLDRFEIPYRVEPRLVRGLDYYERTVFEVVSRSLGAQNALLGGGRYDGLVEALGGPAVPGLGFAVGMERLLALVPEDRVPRSILDVVLVALGREGWEASLTMARRLRAAGLRVVMPLRERPLGAQLKRADQLGARYALFVGAGEIAAGRYGLKNLRSGEQIAVDEAELSERLSAPG